MNTEQFPFQALVGGHLTTITGRHECGWYQTVGFGLVMPHSVVRVGDVPTIPRAVAQWAVSSPDRAKVWKRQGCFRREPLTVVERNRRAERARSWLRRTLDGGLMPAAEIIQLARKAGVNEWSLRRAKKHLRIGAVKVGGRRQGWGAKWFWTMAGAER